MIGSSSLRRRAPAAIVVFGVSIIGIVPFYAMLIMSSLPTEQIMSALPLLPGREALPNLESVLAAGFLRFFFNSFYVAALASMGGAFLGCMAGYAFAKFEFRFKKVLFFAVLGSVMIPPQLSLVGLTIEMRLLGWMNSHLPLIIPPMAYAVGVYFVRSFAEEAIPISLLESARADGASEFVIFTRIALPLLKPAFLTVVLLLYVWSWNNYIYPLVMVNDNSLYTVPLALSSLGDMFRADYGARMMALMVGTVPTIALMVLGRRYLIEGLAGTSVKE